MYHSTQPHLPTNNAPPAACLDVPVVAVAGVLHAPVQAGADEGLAQCKGHLGVAVKVTVCAAVADHVALRQAARTGAAIRHQACAERQQDCVRSREY
jgi:hypothetical protein